MSRRGRWIPTFSGGRFFPFDPRPADLNIRDIAHHTAALCRWTGAPRIHYSVAEHSLRISWWLEEKYPSEPDLWAWGLHHDDAEAVLNDLSKFIKLEMDAYIELENTVLHMIIVDKLGLPWPMPEPVEYADGMIAFDELRQLFVGDYSAECEGLGLGIEIKQPYRAADAEGWFLFRHGECERAREKVRLLDSAEV